MLFPKQLLITISITLCIFSIVNAQVRKATADKVIAVIDDRMILQSDVKSALTYARPGEVANECAVIENTLISKILALQAERDSLTVTADDVDQELDRYVRRILVQVGSYEEFEKQSGMLIEQFKKKIREDVKENLLSDATKQHLLGNIKVTPAEVKSFFESIPKEQLPFIETRVEVAQIVFYPIATREMEQKAIDELNDYKRQVQSKSASFEQVAKRFTHDLGSKDRGGQYQLNRNQSGWDPAFMTAVFRLRVGEISAPVKSKFGYHIILLEQRQGDDAVIRHILRMPLISDQTINATVATLDSVRSKLIEGRISLADAFKTYNNGSNPGFTEAYFRNSDGSMLVTLDEIDKNIITTLATLQPGEYSKPEVTTDEQQRKAVRLVYLKSRKPAHEVNMRDDYELLTQQALMAKQNTTLQKWISDHVSDFELTIDPEVLARCPQLSAKTGGRK